ncbi:MAG: GLUG motif-containing protein [Phycisphaerales bacterium]
MKKILCGFLFLFYISNSFGAYSGGSGTNTSPYLIATAEDINTLGSTPADWNKYFKMTADINMAGFADTQYKVIGDSSTKFTGTFDGNGHKIHKLNCTTSSTEYLGIFGRAFNATIKKLGIEEINLSATGGNCGGLIAHATRCSISDCYITGKIRGNFGIGGLAGYQEQGIIKNCYSTVLVSCSSTSTSPVGCLVGVQSRGIINNCYSTGNVTVLTSGYDIETGGLVGFCVQQSQITNSYATGMISGYNYVGGFAGYIEPGVTIKNCYATGAVSGNNYIGGFVGNNNSRYLSNCYAAGTVSSTTVSETGGFAGYNGYSLQNCFWDQEASEQSNGAGSGSVIGLTGKTTAEMKQMSTFSSAGWNIAYIYGTDGTDLVMISEGQDYPTINLIYCRDCSAELPLTGSGTEEAPYQVNTAEDFAAIGNHCSSWDKYFILNADIDLDGLAISSIGNFYKRFTGNFDGQGFVIRNAKINTPDKSYVGLFGRVCKGGAIANLGVEDVNISGKKCVGGLVGYISDGSISNCYVSGYVKPNSSAFAGGLVGFSARSTISDCNSNVHIIGSGMNIGGLAGCNGKRNIISNCQAFGTITDVNFSKFDSSVGGLIGSNSGTIINSFAEYDIEAIVDSSSAYFYIGGIAGDNTGKIIRSYTNSNISICTNASTATINAGGMTGLNKGDMNDCYTTGQIIFNCCPESTYMIGGVAGLSCDNSIHRCYSKCEIGSGATPEADCAVGGVVGFNMNSAVSGCFWDIQTSGKTISGGGKGLTTEQMKTMLLYQNAGWADNGWVMNDGVDYPRLEWEDTEGAAIGLEQEPPLTGSGTVEAPYQIWTAADFAYLSWYKSLIDKHFVLMADIDLANIRIHPIGEFGPFTGSFRGNGHIIKNLTIYEPTNCYTGVFGRLGASGVITNFGINNASIVGGNFVGGLIGKNEGGTISCCYSTGTIDGLSDVGGIIGKNSSGMIDNSFSTAAVTVWPYNNSISYGGGLIANVDSGTVSKCYSAGLVSPTSSSYTGGLIGRATTTTAISCFWDTSTSGKTTSAGGTGAAGRTTAQMQYTYTFLNAGWDFLGETTNGIKEIWIISSAQYPSLTWQTNKLVPSVISMTQADAENTIITMGLTVGTRTKVFSSTVPNGCIISQSPVAGTGALQGTLINLVISFNGGGNGTETNPFKIADANALLALAAAPSEYGKCFTLTSDIDLHGATISKALISPNANSVDGGFHGTRFTGIFDGHGHKISNLSVSYNGSNDHVGLFGYLANSGQIRNLKIENLSVTGARFIGGIVGTNEGTIFNCSFNGIVHGGQIVGGLVGENNGNIVASYFDGNVEGITTNSDYIGGLVGSNSGTINNCYAMYTVNGSRFVGGLAGHNYLGSIINCYSRGNTNGSAYVGGVSGCNYSGNISNCYSTGTVNSTPSGTPTTCYVGGLSGYNYGDISNCYSSCMVSFVGSNLSYTGGLVGFNISGGNISKCYSTGTITSSTSSIGGLTASNSGTIVNCFWDVNSSGLTSSAGGTSKTTAEMKTLSTFTNAGWDFVGETANGTNNYWRMCADGQNYPKLSWDFKPGDFECPDGVNLYDLRVLVEHWLAVKLKYDLYKADNQNIVNFLDLNIFANTWNGNNLELANFMAEWLWSSNYADNPAADINGDGFVNLADFTVFAENWMKE